MTLAPDEVALLERELFTVNPHSGRVYQGAIEVTASWALECARRDAREREKRKRAHAADGDEATAAARVDPREWEVLVMRG